MLIVMRLAHSWHADNKDISMFESTVNGKENENDAIFLCSVSKWLLRLQMRYMNGTYLVGATCHLNISVAKRHYLNWKMMLSNAS